MALALFDLDNTLIDGDSDHLWGEFIVDRGLITDSNYQQKNDAFYQEYVEGNMDILAYLKFCLEPLTRKSLAELHELHAIYKQELILPIIKAQTPSLIERHRKQNDQLVVITATNRFVAEPIATHLGIENTIATEPEISGERFTGEIIGTPCYQEGKITRLQNWLVDQQKSAQNQEESTIEEQISKAYFYSDSINDLPLLEIVGHPVVVDGDPQLKAIAKERNWESISLKAGL